MRETYVPSSMPRPADSEVIFVLEAAHFMSVVSNGDDRILVSHVPADIRFGNAELSSVQIRFHFATSNDHWRALEESPEVLLVVRGPDAYISPRWYDHENVPTWDYAFVHIRGAAERLTDVGDVEDHLYALIHQMEPDLDVRREFASQYYGDVRPFRLVNPTVEPVFKMSQDKSAASVSGVCRGLRNRAAGSDVETARLIEHLRETRAE